MRDRRLLAYAFAFPDLRQLLREPGVFRLSTTLSVQTRFWLARLPVQHRLVLALVPLLVLLALVLVLAIGSGSAPIPYTHVVQITLGLPLDEDIPQSQITIVQQVRLPRILVAALIGAALAAAGTVMQGIFQNPLAEPGILGVSAGGAAGAVLAISSGAALAGVWLMPLFALVGSLAAAAVVYLLALERGRAQILMLILAGTALNVFLGALVSLALLTTEEIAQAQLILNWLVGGLAGRGWSHVGVLTAPILIGGAVIYVFSRDLNLLLLGEDAAQGLGTPVGQTRLVLLALAALLTGVCVSVAGPIGFVGLVVPHILRLIVGPDHRVLLPTSALGGAIFLVLTDTLARLLIVYQEIPVGVITGLVGGPFFLFLLWRYRKQTRLL